MRTVPAMLVAVVLLFLPSAPDATATSTVCSNPSRARVLDRLTVSIPGGNEPAFATIIREFEGVTDMGRSEVTSSDKGGFRERTIIFQSPQVSVNIHIDTERGSSIARITVNRTCYTDALEEWKPYWKAFRKFLDSKGLKRAEIRGQDMHSSAPSSRVQLCYVLVLNPV